MFRKVNNPFVLVSPQVTSELTEKDESPSLHISGCLCNNYVPMVRYQMVTVKVL